MKSKQSIHLNLMIALHKADLCSKYCKTFNRRTQTHTHTHAQTHACMHMRQRKVPLEILKNELLNLTSNSIILVWAEKRKVYGYLILRVLRLQLIGHKKPSVPIFATGLSLLEPIRGGGRERGLGVGGPPAKGTTSSMITSNPTLVDPRQRHSDPPTQVGNLCLCWNTVWSTISIWCSFTFNAVWDVL